MPEAKRSLFIGSARDPAGGLAVTVRDTGPGLKECDDIERIFTPFYTTKPTGMGLGLTITRSIVESHDGRIWAEADTPKGAVFRFTLPDMAGTS